MADLDIPEGTVTVLFTDLVESTTLNQTLGDDRAREVGREIESMARGLVESNRGVLIKEMGAGLMAAFASARRAVACAQEMQREMRCIQRGGLGNDVAMRIGLHTGEVISEEGDIHGETVIIASRVEGLAPPNGVLASDTVHGVLGTSRDELIEQGEVNLKGIEAPWRLWLVPGIDDEDVEGLVDADLTPYVGRVALREQLRTAVEEASAGRGGMVFIGGEAGAGKSRLTREMIGEATRLGMSIRVGHCLDMESPPPYQPVIDQLEQAARELDPSVFREALGINAPEIARLMPTLHQYFDDIADPPHLSPDQERRYMLHGVSEFIERACAAQPLLLVYEDLHWADESTMLLIRHLAQRISGQPLLIVGTYRSNELEPDRALATQLPPLRRDHGAVDIALEPLGRDEVSAVIEARAGKPPPDSLLDLVFVESDGNPFFVEEVYKHLRDVGKLFDDDGNWKSDIAVGEREVPRNVLLVIGRRLDRLDPDARRQLGYAAVIGRRFDFDLLADVTAVDDDTLFDALEVAERMNLVTEDEEGTGYLFVHEQIRQALVGELSLARRQRAHLKIADALDAKPRRAVTSIAHHLDHAGSAAPRERTASSLLEATDDAIESLAFEDAIRYLDRASEYTDEDLYMIDSRRAHALRGSGRMNEALDVLSNALKRPGVTDTTVAELRFQRTALCLDQYEAADALDDIDAVLSTRRASGDADGETEALLALGRAHYILSLDDPSAAHASKDAYQEAYDLAKSRADHRSMVLALVPTTWFTDYWAEYVPTAIANADEAMLLAEELGDADLVLDARFGRLKLGGMRRGMEEAKMLSRDLEARRDPVKLNLHCFWLMWQSYFAGEYDLTVETCDRGIELAEILGTPPVQYGSIKALALLELGRFDLVEDAIAQEVTDDDHPFGQAMAVFARAAYLARIEAFEPAERIIVDAVDRAFTMSRVWMQHSLKSFGTVLLARSRAAGRNGLSGLETAMARIELPLEAAAQAEVDILEGRARDAIDAMEPRVECEDGLLGRVGLLALEVLTAGYLADGRPEDAEATARRGLPIAIEQRAATLEFRFRCRLADAVASLGDSVEAGALRMEATRQLETLGSRIENTELRRWFTEQPLARSL